MSTQKYISPDEPRTIFSVQTRAVVDGRSVVRIDEVGGQYDNFNISEKARAEALAIIDNDYKEQNRDISRIPMVGLRRIANVLNIEYNNSFLQQQFVDEIRIRLSA